MSKQDERPGRLWLYSQLGFGALVGDIQTSTGQQVPYAAFIAPALLATAAMNGAVVAGVFHYTRVGPIEDPDDPEADRNVVRDGDGSADEHHPNA